VFAHRVRIPEVVLGEDLAEVDEGTRKRVVGDLLRLHRRRPGEYRQITLPLSGGPYFRRDFGGFVLIFHRHLRDGEAVAVVNAAVLDSRLDDWLARQIAVAEAWQPPELDPEVVQK
jgi:hypothetical protein